MPSCLLSSSSSSLYKWALHIQSHDVIHRIHVKGVFRVHSTWTYFKHPLKSFTETTEFFFSMVQWECSLPELFRCLWRVLKVALEEGAKRTMFPYILSTNMNEHPSITRPKKKKKNICATSSSSHSYTAKSYRCHLISVSPLAARIWCIAYTKHVHNVLKKYNQIHN